MDKVVKFNEYGLWSVSTEGDCEGNTLRQLGVYRGHIDEIAMALANQAMYSLKFKPVDAESLPSNPTPVSSVSVQMDIDSGTWNMTPEERVEYMKEMCSGRPVSFSPGRYYASTVMHFSEEDVQEAKRIAALNKLTPEERKLLGL